MKTIRLYLTALLLALTATAQADDYAYLNVEGDDGNFTIEVQTVQKITFTQDHLVFHLSSGQERQVPLATLGRLAFSDQAGTGVERLSSDEGVRFCFDNGQVRITGAYGRQVAVYGIGGKMLHNAVCNDDDLLLNLSGLRRGVYIVRVGQEARKVLAR